MSEKMFVVELDGRKTLSYTMNGRKYNSGRPMVLPESKIAPFKEACVFLIYTKAEEQNAKEENTIKLKRRNVQIENNPEDKSNNEVESKEI